MDNKKLILITAMVLILIAGGVGFWYLSQRKVQNTISAPVGTIGAAQEASESVPEIQTNPGQKVPEINPLDRANPFKYTNPLR